MDVEVDPAIASPFESLINLAILRYGNDGINAFRNVPIRGFA